MVDASQAVSMYDPRWDWDRCSEFTMVLECGNLSDNFRLQGRWPRAFQILMLTLEAIGLLLPSPHGSLFVNSSSLLMLVST